MARLVHLLTVVGARPQIIKAAAVSRAIAGASGIRETILHTGQHFDADMSQVFFDELDVPAPAIELGAGADEAGRVERMAAGIASAIRRIEPQAVLLYGDTDSTLAGTLAAQDAGVPIAHVEAGLRSFDASMPEEYNRITCDRASTWLFCPTTNAVMNLRNEGIIDHPDILPTSLLPHVGLSGDVMFDNALYYGARAQECSQLLGELAIDPGAYFLVTLHRQQNTDEPARLNAIMEAVLQAHHTYGLEVVMPLHPRTRKQMEASLAPDLMNRIKGAKGFRLLPPVGFLDMIALEQNARLVLTDSGGVQKEAYFFGKPCVIPRSSTEWVELTAAGQAQLVDADPLRILAAIGTYLGAGMPACEALFGDGRAAERIVERLGADLR